MIGAFGDHAQTFLLVFATITTLVFALPIFFVPIRWARVMQFRITDDTDLSVYFGRCLGAFILIVEALAFRAALTRDSNLSPTSAMDASKASRLDSSDTLNDETLPQQSSAIT